MWILRNNKSGELTYILMPTEGAISHSMNPGAPPSQDGSTVIAWYHTHPNVGHGDWSPNPSPGDVNYSWKYNIPGIVGLGQSTQPIFFGPGIPKS
jgi:hypothetical protein